MFRRRPAPEEKKQGNNEKKKPWKKSWKAGRKTKQPAAPPCLEGNVVKYGEVWTREKAQYNSSTADWQNSTRRKGHRRKAETSPVSDHRRPPTHDLNRFRVQATVNPSLLQGRQAPCICGKHGDHSSTVYCASQCRAYSLPDLPALAFPELDFPSTSNIMS
jgi:hypothetical protein